MTDVTSSKMKRRTTANPDESLVVNQQTQALEKDLTRQSDTETRCKAVVRAATQK